MKLAFGLKAHSGWAALIALGSEGDNIEVIDRRRIELVQEEWAKQPYHAAEELEKSEARKVVKRGISEAHKNAKREIQAAIKRVAKYGHKISACAVLMGVSMPEWSVDEILAVHFRMHKAEGVLFREALADAATKCGLSLVRVPEKELNDYAEKVLATKSGTLSKSVSDLGKAIGPPWGKDQKEATLAAMIALRRY